MKFCVFFIQAIWVFFVSLVHLGCADYGPPGSKLPALDVMTDIPVMPTEEPFKFRSGIFVYPKPGTSLNRTLLAQRDHYATIFTDPYGYLWTISTALSLTDQDFANAGMFTAGKTDEGDTFYYGKVNNWEIQADCVVYTAASAQDFVSLRRNQDQGACPTSAGYAAWLPQASMSEPNQTQSGTLWAYGANNHWNNIIHGVFEEIEAYGNDPFGWTCNDFQVLSDCLAYAGIRLTGAKWDSAEFVSRYLLTKHSDFLGYRGPAKYWYQSYLGLFKMANCGSVPPEVGDVLLSNGGSHGHAAIVRAVSDHSVTVIQQNWFESDQDDHHVLPMTTAGNHHCVSAFGDGYPVVGWLRKQ